MNRVAYLSVTEFARRARVSPPAVYRAVQRGEIPTLKIGKSIRIPESALQPK